MGYGLSDLNFEEWVVHIFDHPVTDPAWYWDMDAEWWHHSHEEAVDYMTKLFEYAGNILVSYTDEQANQGLWYLSSTTISDYFNALHDVTIPIQKRLRCLESIYSLFKQLYTVRCSLHLSHLVRSDEPNPTGYSIINLSCYMWWDNVSTIYTGAIIEDYLELYSRTMLDVLKRILELESIACQESALHGLSHYQSFSRHFREDVTKHEVIDIISNWLKTHKKIPASLKTYALAARFGGVL